MPICEPRAGKKRTYAGIASREISRIGSFCLDDSKEANSPMLDGPSPLGTSRKREGDAVEGAEAGGAEGGSSAPPRERAESVTAAVRTIEANETVRFIGARVRP